MTEREREWLERRRLFDGVNCWSHYSCQSCEHYGVGRWEGYHHPCGVSVFGGCPKVNPDRYDLQKAAEFEARVAAKLADPYFPPMDVGSDGPRLLMPPADRLRCARLQVEEEMDANRI